MEWELREGSLLIVCMHTCVCRHLYVHVCKCVSVYLYTVCLCVSEFECVCLCMHLGVLVKHTVHLAESQECINLCN